MVSVKHIKYLCLYIKEHSLSTPAGFEAKSYHWLAEHYNGIGAEWMPAFLRQRITKWFSPMEPTALVHDVDFLNKNKSYWNFTKANLRLAYNGCKSGYPGCGIALAVVCQLFGWTAWKEGKETMIWFYHFEEDGKK